MVEKVDILTNILTRGTGKDAIDFSALKISVCDTVLFYPLTILSRDTGTPGNRDEVPLTKRAANRMVHEFINFFTSEDTDTPRNCHFKEST